MASMDESRSESTKHIMFSYQRKSEKIVLQFYDYLIANQSIPIWMDQHGGVKQYLSTSLAEGVENCCLFVCFLTAEYQSSEYCKKELRYACELKKAILPCILPTDDHWKPSEWLGFTISDMIYVNLKHIDQFNFEDKAKELIERIHSIVQHQESQHSIQLEEEDDDDDNEEFETDLSFQFPEDICQGPTIANDLILKTKTELICEGDSSIIIINQLKEIECNQDLFAKDGYFQNSFLLSDLIFYNKTSEINSILKIRSEYENEFHQWIECEHKFISNHQSILTFQPYQSMNCSIQINIRLKGIPGCDNEHRFRAHSLLPQPLRIQIHIQDLFNKHSSIIIQQVNKPLNLPELNKLIDKLNLNRKHLIDFVYADDCSIDIRYFVLIYLDKQNEETCVKFRFGYDFSSSFNPCWNKAYFHKLERQAKQTKQYEILVHEDIFSSIIQSKIFLNQNYKIQAIQFEIRTQTSLTRKTIRLSLKEIFSQQISFF